MMVTPPAIGVIPVLFTNAVIGLFPGRLDGGDVLRLQPLRPWVSYEATFSPSSRLL
jgi:hypothetical protein